MKVKHLIIGVFCISLISLYYFYNPEGKLFPFPKCPFFSLTGLHCPGCGSQRALHQLLHFNIIQTLNHNALYIVGILTIVYNLVIKGINHYSKKNYFNYLYHTKTPIVIGIIVVTFWILRNIPHEPFSCLAP